MNFTEEDEIKVKKALESMRDYFEKHHEAIKEGMNLVFEDTQKSIQDAFNRMPLNRRIKLISRLKEIEYDCEKSSDE
jgi:hypothetical protein